MGFTCFGAVWMHKVVLKQHVLTALAHKLQEHVVKR